MGLGWPGMERAQLTMTSLGLRAVCPSHGCSHLTLCRLPWSAMLAWLVRASSSAVEGPSGPRWSPSSASGSHVNCIVNFKLYCITGIEYLLSLYCCIIVLPGWILPSIKTGQQLYTAIVLIIFAVNCVRMRNIFHCEAHGNCCMRHQPLFQGTEHNLQTFLSNDNQAAGRYCLAAMGYQET